MIIVKFCEVHVGNGIWGLPFFVMLACFLRINDMFDQLVVLKHVEYIPKKNEGICKLCY